MGSPSCLLLLGDQIYADQLSPAMRERAEHRSRPDERAADELVDFEEYAEAYVEAWSEPAIRWLLSTVPSVMIFDDHEIRGEWKISEDWLQKARAETRHPRQVPDGLMAYWIYQHIGNLGLDELEGNELLRRVRSGRRRAPAAGRDDRCGLPGGAQPLELPSGPRPHPPGDRFAGRPGASSPARAG